MKRFLSSLYHPFRLLNGQARLFVLAIFFDGLLFSGFNLFFNLYILKAGFSREFLGLVNSAPSVSALLLGVPMGLLSDRIGRKRAMIIGLSLANIAILGMLLTRSEFCIILLALAWGFTGQLYILSQAPFMMKASDDRTRDTLFSLSFGMFPLASALGNFLAGYLPDLFTRWFGQAVAGNPYQSVLLACVSASFLVLVPLSLLREGKTPAASEPGQTATPVGRPRVWGVLFRPLTIKLSLPLLIQGFGAATLIPYFNVYFSEHYHLGDAALGTLFSLGSLMTGVACLFGPQLVGKLGGKIRTITLGQGISLIFLLAIGFSPWPWLAVVGYLVRGALMNMVAPLFDAFSLELSHESEHGAVNSIRSMAWNVGWAIGPYVSGLVQQSWGFTPLFISTAVLYGLAISLTWLFFKPTRALPSGVPA